MNIEHRDIDKFIPFGEALRGFVNQKFITPPVLQSILKERGIFVLNADKDYMVPIMQTLLLSPAEFDKVRDAFARKEDNEKKISREISFSANTTLYQSDIMQIDVDDFIKRQLPTCKIKQSIRFVQVDNNPNHLTAKFTLIRNDINKCWYEQTNEFSGSVEIINENGKGAIRITHTSSETKDFAEYIIRNQIRLYKAKGLLNDDARPQKILYSTFTNTTRFAFFFRLTTKIENNEIFNFVDIKDISIKPQEDCALPVDFYGWKISNA